MLVSDWSTSTALARVDRQRWRLLRHRVVRTYLNMVGDVEHLDDWLRAAGSPSAVSATLYVVARREMAAADGESALALPRELLTPTLEHLAVHVQQDRHMDASDDLTLVPRLAWWLGEATNELRALRSLTLDLSDCMGFHLNGLLFAVGALAALQHLTLRLPETGAQGCPAVFPTPSSIVQFRGHLFPRHLRSLHLDLPLVIRYPIPSNVVTLTLLDCLAESEWPSLRDFRLGLRGHHLASTVGVLLARVLRALPRVHRWELDLADNNLCPDGVADLFAGGWPVAGGGVVAACGAESRIQSTDGRRSGRTARRHAARHGARPAAGS